MTSCFSHLSSTTFNNRRISSKHAYGTKETFDIHQSSHMLNIFSIHPGFISNFQLISAINLSQTCKPWFDIICTIFVPFRNKHILIPQTWPGTDHRHISYKDIPNLRQFIQAVRAKKFADPCNILIRILKHMGWDIVWCRHFHCPEFM